MIRFLVVAAALAIVAWVLRGFLPLGDDAGISRPLPPATEEGGLVEPETGTDDPRLGDVYWPGLRP